MEGKANRGGGARSRMKNMLRILFILSFKITGRCLAIDMVKVSCMLYPFSNELLLLFLQNEKKQNKEVCH